MNMCGNYINSQLLSLYTSKDTEQSTDSYTKPRILDSQTESLLIVGLVASHHRLASISRSNMQSMY